MKVVDKESGEESIVDYTVDKDECNRPSTTLEGLSQLKPVRGDEHFITAGNASQLSDGAASVVVMDSKLAEQKGLSLLVHSGVLLLLVVSLMKWVLAQYLRS